MCWFRNLKMMTNLGDWWPVVGVCACVFAALREIQIFPLGQDDKITRHAEET